MEKPILFTGAMVRAILAGQKTQTRRVVKPQPTRFPDSYHDRPENWCYDVWNWPPIHQPATYATPDVLAREVVERCPYGVPGDHLWVRETWAENVPPSGFIYRADADTHNGFPEKWKPSIFMPRKFSRMTLEVTAVRVERLQEIGNADAKAEGVGFTGQTYREGYAELWDAINGKTAPWSENPWVWVISFKRIVPLIHSGSEVARAREQSQSSERGKEG